MSKYPRWFKHKKDGSVFKFLSISVAECVNNGKCTDNDFEVGNIYEHSNLLESEK